MRDLIVTARPCPGNGSPGCAYNVNQALLEGWSFGAGGRLGAFALRASLDLLDARDLTTGLRLARRAGRHGTLAAEYTGESVAAGAEIIFSGERHDDAANRVRLGGYGVLNLYASRALTKDWTLFGRWDNVFDKDYEFARGYATTGSSVFVGVRYGY